MNHESVHIDHPLLEKLRLAEKEAAQRFPESTLWPASFHLAGFEAIGLRIFKDLTCRYYDWCSPLNCWTFADTGGDGIHFSFLAEQDKIHADSPVIATYPSDCGQSFVVGENLFDFLCLGSSQGFMALNFDAANEVSIDEHQQQVLAFLIELFKLRAWSGPEHFADLQRRFAGLLQLPEEMHDAPNPPKLYLA